MTKGTINCTVGSISDHFARISTGDVDERSQNLAIPLNRNVPESIGGKRGQSTISTERLVGPASPVKAKYGVAVSAGYEWKSLRPVPAHDNLAVSLKTEIHSAGKPSTGKIGLDYPAITKGSVQTTIAPISSQYEIGIANVTHCHKPASAILLDSQESSRILAHLRSCEDDAVMSEITIESRPDRLR